MPRKLKPHKVGNTHHNASGLSADIFLDRESCEFFADLHEQRFTAPTKLEVSRLIYAAMGAWRPPTWTQIILITGDFGGYESTWRHDLKHGSRLEFSFDRVEVSERESGNEISRPFLPRGESFGEEEPEDWQLSRRAEGNDWETVCGDYDGKTRLPYDDDTWRVLVELKRRTDDLSARLRVLLEDNPKQLKVLADTVFRQLQAPGEGD